MRLSPAFEVNGFSGINNVADPARMAAPASGIMPLIEAVNVDIDDSRMLSRARGFDLALAAGFHSLWNNRKREFALGVQNGALYKLSWKDGELMATSIASPLDPAARMVYVETDDRIFMTNGSFIGYLQEDTLHDLAEPDQTFKTRMPPGHLIEFYNNQLYVAVERVIFYSDALAWGRTDLRKNFLPFTGRIRMIQAVLGGLFVSDDDGTYFLNGGNAKELVKVDKSPDPVFPGGFVKVDGEMMGTRDPMAGDVVLMVLKDGIFLGGPEGLFFNLTKNRYQPREMGEIASLIRVDPDTHQVVFIGAVTTPAQTGEIELRLPTLIPALAGSIRI